MTAIEDLQAAQAAGVDIIVKGDNLVLTASSPPPDAVVEALTRAKAGIIALLRPGSDGWTTEEWRAFFEERAAIAEYDGGLSRADAEALAFKCCVTDWQITLGNQRTFPTKQYARFTSRYTSSETW